MTIRIISVTKSDGGACTLIMTTLSETCIYFRVNEEVQPNRNLISAQTAII